MTPTRRGHILIVDDEVNMCRILAKVLVDVGHEVDYVHSGKEALEFLDREQVDVVLSDMKMPGMDGIELLQRIKKLDTSMAVLLMTAYGTIDTAVEAMKLGAYHYIRKPFNNQEIIRNLENALERKALLDKTRYLSEALEDRYRLENIVGKSEPMQKMFDLIRKVATTGSTVLIQGESGTGKELVAHAIHHLSDRRDEKFVTINCGAFPPGLLESELFGYEKGAFTDARTTKTGLIETANGGTLFLDEIGEMQLELQVKILRVLEQKEIRRVGGVKYRKVDIRILSATNRDLEEEMEEKRFRHDLFYRISIFPIYPPPLRKRLDDVPMLLDHFIEKFNQKLNRSIEGITEEAMKILLEYDWPGNVRELENCVERAAVIREHGMITPDDLTPKVQGREGSSDFWSLVADMPLQQAREIFEKRYLEEALRKNMFNVTHTATMTSLSRRHLQEKIRKYQIKRP